MVGNPTLSWVIMLKEVLLPLTSYGLVGPLPFRWIYLCRHLESWLMSKSPGPAGNRSEKERSNHLFCQIYYFLGEVYFFESDLPHYDMSSNVTMLNWKIFHLMTSRWYLFHPTAKNFFDTWWHLMTCHDSVNLTLFEEPGFGFWNLRGHPGVQKHCRATWTILVIQMCYVGNRKPLTLIAFYLPT